MSDHDDTQDDFDGITRRRTVPMTFADLAEQSQRPFDMAARLDHIERECFRVVEPFRFDAGPEDGCRLAIYRGERFTIRYDVPREVEQATGILIGIDLLRQLQAQDKPDVNLIIKRAGDVERSFTLLCVSGTEAVVRGRKALEDSEDRKQRNRDRIGKGRPEYRAARWIAFVLWQKDYSATQVHNRINSELKANEIEYIDGVEQVVPTKLDTIYDWFRKFEAGHYPPKIDSDS